MCADKREISEALHGGQGQPVTALHNTRTLKWTKHEGQSKVSANIYCLMQSRSNAIAIQRKRASVCAREMERRQRERERKLKGMVKRENTTPGVITATSPTQPLMRLEASGKNWPSTQAENRHKTTRLDQITGLILAKITGWLNTQTQPKTRES